MTKSRRWGVGIVGAGPGVSALHLPTLDRVAEDFGVVHIADSGSGRAAQLAEAYGARHSTGTRALLADPEVEIVLICSPPEAHATQVLDAVAAGKRAVLCEKPLALTAHDAGRVIDACREAGVVLLVGTNHLYDPAWLRAKHHLVVQGERVRTVSVTIAIPPNARYHGVVASEGQRPGEAPVAASAPMPVPDLTNPRVAASVIERLVQGLTAHDLPLVRDLAHTIDAVLFVRPVAPIGYCIGLRAGDVLVRLTAVMLQRGADALWRTTIGTEHDQIDISFPPAFVHDGSAQVVVRRSNGQTVTYPRSDEDGYVAEWRTLAEMLRPGATREYGEILADAEYLTELAARVVALALEHPAEVSP